VLHHG